MDNHWPASQVQPPSVTASPSSAAHASDSRVALVSSLSTSDLIEFSRLSLPVQHLISAGLGLTRENLPYKYGSDDPANGGMDCSGTIHYLLQQAGLSDVPRDSSEMYEWAWQKGSFQAVISSNPDTFELSRLQPGDLLFWSGTYRIDRDPPVTHVMIYLGTSRRTGRRVMVGASEGRTFNDQPRFGVSVFDFKLPRAAALQNHDSTNGGEVSRFIGYSPVPGLEKSRSHLESSENASLSHG